MRAALTFFLLSILNLSVQAWETKYDTVIHVNYNNERYGHYEEYNFTVKGGKWGLADLNGVELIPAIYEYPVNYNYREEYQHLCEEGFALEYLIFKSEGGMTMFSPKGEKLTPDSALSIDPYYGDEPRYLLLVEYPSGYELLDTNGNKAVDYFFPSQPYDMNDNGGYLFHENEELYYYYPDSGTFKLTPSQLFELYASNPFNYFEEDPEYGEIQYDFNDSIDQVLFFHTYGNNNHVGHIRNAILNILQEINSKFYEEEEEEFIGTCVNEVKMRFDSTWSYEILPPWYYGPRRYYYSEETAEEIYPKVFELTEFTEEFRRSITTSTFSYYHYKEEGIEPYHFTDDFKQGEEGFRDDMWHRVQNDSSAIIYDEELDSIRDIKREDFDEYGLAISEPGLIFYRPIEYYESPEDEVYYLEVPFRDCKKYIKKGSLLWKILKRNAAEKE